MTSQDVLAVFEKVGGYIRDSHIVYTSGNHGSSYLNKDAIYPHTAEISLLCKEIAQHFEKEHIDVVAGPALGGIVLSQWTAHHLSDITHREVLGVYTEKTPEKQQIFTRGYHAFIPGKRVLVVEDIVNTGGSVQKVIREVQTHGGDVVGVGILVNRNPAMVTAAALNIPKLSALAAIQMDIWDEKDCPLCKKAIPINTTVGKGREYLAKSRK